MKSEYVKYGIYFFIAVLFVMLLQLYFPNPINWNKNFNTQNKDPYGLYVFNQELPNLLKDQKLSKTSLTPYEYFSDSLQNPINETTFLIVQNNNAFDKNSGIKLLEKVKEGADLVISLENYYYTFSNFILDSLQVNFYNEKVNQLYFVHENFSKDTLEIKDAYNYIYTVKHPEKHQVLAKMEHNPVFISTKYGKGTIYLSSTPILLTNYYLLNEKKDFSKFTEAFASVIKKKNVIWFDEDHDSNSQIQNQSIFKVLFKHQSLRFAWYTLIIGLILFVFFYGKRKQRIIPIVEPLKNTTIEYIETVGNLYYQENNHTQLLDKQIKYVLNQIRVEWHIPTQQMDEDFKKRLQQKSLASEEIINDFVSFIIHFDLKHNYSQSDLIRFNELVEKINIYYGKYRK